MPDSNKKADLLKAQGLTPAQIESLLGIIDNPETASVEPFIAEIKVYANAKSKLVFPERVVHALGGDGDFVQPPGLDSVQYVSGRGPDPGGRTDPATEQFDYQNPESFITNERLRPRGGNAIYIPTKPYTWGRRTNNKWVTLRYPSWMTIVAIQWALFHCIKENAKKPTGFFRAGKKRFYLVEDVESQLKTTNLVE
ncbi:MAG: hypothetical protein SXA11_06925 [Cyanobacteriota bacterium]|nr:hypothetical protein [Cyanobacteriota bacterium]